MLHFLIAITCLLVIDEYTLQLRHRYIARRQLRAWQKRVRPLTPPPAAPRPAPHPANPFALSADEEAILERCRREGAQQRARWEEIERGMQKIREENAARSKRSEGCAH